ncbi:unnamed protein product, partial [Polarella glacialis]
RDLWKPVCQGPALDVPGSVQDAALPGSAGERGRGGQLSRTMSNRYVHGI